MDVQIIVACAICLMSFLNLFFTILLSNSIFRLIASLNSNEEKQSTATTTEDSGLVDVQNSLTYDPRFRRTTSQP